MMEVDQETRFKLQNKLKQRLQEIDKESRPVFTKNFKGEWETQEPKYRLYPMEDGMYKQWNETRDGYIIRYKKITGWKKSKIGNTPELESVEEKITLNVKKEEKKDEKKAEDKKKW